MWEFIKYCLLCVLLILTGGGSVPEGVGLKEIIVGAVTTFVLLGLGHGILWLIAAIVNIFRTKNTIIKKINGFYYIFKASYDKSTKNEDICMTYTVKEKKVTKKFINCKVPNYFDEKSNEQYLDVNIIDYYQALFDYAYCILVDIKFQSNFSYALGNEELYILISQHNNNSVERGFNKKLNLLLEIIEKYRNLNEKLI